MKSEESLEAEERLKEVQSCYDARTRAVDLQTKRWISGLQHGRPPPHVYSVT